MRDITGSGVAEGRYLPVAREVEEAENVQHGEAALLRAARCAAALHLAHAALGVVSGLLVVTCVCGGRTSKQM